MLKKFIALSFLIVVISGLAGCQPSSSALDNSFSDTAEKSEPPLSEIHFFGTLASGNGDGAKTKNGFFYIEPQSSSYANIQYIDFSSKKKVSVCSNPACTHDNETCSSYLEWSGGYPYIAANSSKIILISANAGSVNEMIYHEKALPHIQIADLSGANRKTLLSLSANEDIQIGTACNEEYLYLIKKGVEGNSSVMDFCKVSLSDGALQTICRLPDGNSFILGAEDQYIVVVCYSPATNGNLYSPDQVSTFMCFDMTTETCISQKELPLNVLDHPPQNFVHGTTLYSFSPRDNTLSVYDLKNNETLRSISPVFDKEVTMGQIDAVFDDNILFSEIFAGSEEDAAYIRYDLSSEKQTPFTLLAEYGENTGRFFPVVPSCSLTNEYLVVYQCDSSDALLADTAGNAVGFVKPEFAFISKEAYWSGIPEYQQLE